MIGSTLYLFGKDAKTDSPIHNTECCPMCKRMIINAGISEVVTADGVVNVRDWIFNDDSLSGRN